MFAKARPAVKKTVAAAFENKVTRPVAQTIAMPVFVAAFVGFHVKEDLRVRKEIRTARKNGTF